MSAHTDNKQALLTGDPKVVLFRFALPMILGNLFQQFYNMADSIIVGRFVNEEALAAVGASYSFTNIFIMVAIGGGIGASVLTSQYLGAGKYTKMKTSVYTALISFLCLSGLLAVIGFWINPIVLQVLKTPANVYPEAVLYLQIYFCGLPFTFMYNILSHNFNALGKSKIPLYLLIFSSVLNIFMDLFMVIALHLGVAGVAIATVISQGISAIASFVILMRLLRTYPTESTVSKFDTSMLIQGTKIAIPSIVQQSIVSIGLLLTQSSINQFGSSALAGFSAGSRLESLCIVPMLGTGNALSTYTAQNLGAGNTERVGKGLRAAYMICGGFALLLILITQTMYRPIITAFVDPSASPVAYETGAAYFRFVGMFYLFMGLKCTTDGALRGAGDVKLYMAANLVNLSIRVSIAIFASPILGMWVIWSAIPLGWFANFIISGLWYRTGHWKENHVI